MINAERLARTFAFLVGIDSVSREEGALAAELVRRFEALGGDTRFDQAAAITAGDCGNLVVRFQGNCPVAPLLLSAHMDTVEPGRGIEAVLQDGVFTSAGDTILGADDKSALAILLETLQVLQDNHLAYGPLELVLTVCEEVGLMGAKNLDFSLLTARFGYVLDATDTEGIITRAPAANRLEFKVYGKDAHAGAAPEKGINAISLASRAIAELEIGRIDRETTCNLGLISGGLATNIVPPLVTVKGEVRSHDDTKLQRVTDAIVAAFTRTVETYPHPVAEEGLPRLEITVEDDFNRTHIPDDHPVVTLARQAAANLGRDMQTKLTGGGADANIFFKHGIMTGVLGTGMRDMHTVRESVGLADMLRTTELLLEIIRLHSQHP